MSVSGQDIVMSTYVQKGVKNIFMEQNKDHFLVVMVDSCDLQGMVMLLWRKFS
jgi:hypothetical protein